VVIFKFDRSAAREITNYGSRNISIAGIVRDVANCFIGCMHFSPDGVVGFHPTVEDQLFLVVKGSGWVTGENRKRVPISEGQAAFWISGETHESGTDGEMIAVVIEGKSLHPEKWMKPLGVDGT
jgi:quercetin dioxygenase-like cupin family protein